MNYGYICVSTDKQTDGNWNSVWTIKDRYRLGDDIQSKVLAFALGLSADIGTTIMLMQVISINRIAKLYGVHRNTVKLFIKKKQLDSSRNIKKIVNLCG